MLDAGHSVLAIDRSLEKNHLIDSGAKWLVADFAGEVSLNSIKSFQPEAIIHCAGTSLVGPSMMNPEEYYNNNFVKTKRLCDFLVKENIKARLVFSSSAATYGNPIMTPCQEVDPVEPISPYGESKLMTEWMLRGYQRAYGLDYVAFRYFNACGADSQGRHGQAAGATHIIARVLESIHNASARFTLNGTDFATADGTCVRDYVHVEDIAAAHVLALSYSVSAGVYNLGTKHGYSNLEVLQAIQQVIGHKLDYATGPQRAGDPAMLTADADKFAKLSGWKPQWTLEDTIRHVWAWYNQ
jgi:UDP-glucose 4-epimerase